MSDAEKAAKQVVTEVMPLVRIGAPMMQQQILAEIARRIDGSMRYRVESANDQEPQLRLVSTNAHHKRDDYKTVGEFLREATGQMRENLADRHRMDFETHRDAMEIFIMEVILRICEQAVRDLSIDADEGNWFDDVLKCVGNELGLQDVTEHRWLAHISEMGISELPATGHD